MVCFFILVTVFLANTENINLLMSSIPSFFLMLYLCLAYEVHSSLSSGRDFSALSSKNFVILLFKISDLIYLELIFVYVVT